MAESPPKAAIRQGLALPNLVRSELKNRLIRSGAVK